MNLQPLSPIGAVEKLLHSLPHCTKEDFPLEHTFADGLYLRQITVPEDTLVVTDIHAKEHATFILKGECFILNSDGTEVKVDSPGYMITPAWTQRLIYVKTETVWITCHANETNEREIKKLEDMFTIKNELTFKDIGALI